ncbi:unnamed protein product [Oppiella nova]|nr:unnamed protein product [Oppiella nova]CAG2179544.1 unnamed protein product [Oppiella nova]
MTSNWS